MSDVENPQLNTPRVAEAREALDALDDTFLQKARLGIMSMLLALGEADFKLLKESLDLSDGNLSTHLALLDDKGYVAVHKEFVRRKPRTTYSPTEKGRAAFQQYLVALERIIQATALARETLHTANPVESGRSAATLNPNRA